MKKCVCCLRKLQLQKDCSGGNQSNNFKFVEQITRAHFYTPFGVVHYARNLALPLGEPRGLPATVPYVIIAQRNGAHPHRYAPLTVLRKAPPVNGRGLFAVQRPCGGYERDETRPLTQLWAKLRGKDYRNKSKNQHILADTLVFVGGERGI